MKVLLLAPLEKDGYSGGQARAARILADGLRDYGGNDLVLYHVVHPHRAEARNRFQAIALRSHFYARFVWTSVRHRPDVLHVFSPCSVAAIVEKTILASVARILGLRTIINLRNDPRPLFARMSAPQHALVRWCLRRYDGAICQFEALREFYVSQVGLPQYAVSKVYNAIEGETAFPSTDLVARRLAARRLIYLGSLQPRKGLDVLLDALSRIDGARRPWLHIVGDSQPASYADDLALMARRLGVDKHVVFHGAKFGREKIALINESLGLVLPSRAEGFPNVVLEAAQLGVPAILTRVGAANDISAVHASGVILIDVDDSAGLASAIELLASGSEDYHARARAAAVGTLKFGVEAMCASVIEAYRSVARSHRRTTTP